MAHITVTQTPQSFALVAGIDPAGRSVIFRGIVFNDGPNTVNWIRQTAAPTSGTPAVKILPNTQHPFSVYGDDHSGATWVWSDYGDSVLVYSSGIPGA